MKTLVFIRGWASTNYSFKKFLKSKPEDQEIIFLAADQLISNNLDEVVDKLEKELKPLESFDLAGHSLGGALAINYVAKYPKKVNRLFLVNTIGYPLEGQFGSESAKIILRNSRKVIKHFDVKLIEAINFLRNPVFHIKLGRFARKLNILEVAQKIERPTLILHGEEDHLVSITVAQSISKAVKGSKLNILPGLDHDWIQTEPKEFWKALKQNSG